MSLFTPDTLLSLPRLSDLRLSPDGATLAFVVGRRDAEQRKYVSDLYEVVVATGETRRLTFGDDNDVAPRFGSHGTLYFLSNRPDNNPPRKQGDSSSKAKAETSETTMQVFALPPRGEPRRITRLSHGVEALEAHGDVLAFAGYVHPQAPSEELQRAKEDARKEAGDSALAYDEIPIRFWDRFHGPRVRHLFHLELGRLGAGGVDDPRDLTPNGRLEYDEQTFDLAPDGGMVIACEAVLGAEHRSQENLVALGLGKDAARRELTHGLHTFATPRFSDDGQRVVAVFHENLEGQTGRSLLAIVDVRAATHDIHAPIHDGIELWPTSPCFSRDGRTIFFAADQRGETPIFAFDSTTRAVRRVTAHGGYSDLCPSPDGRHLYALHSTFDRPPEVVVVDALGTDSAPTRLTQLTDSALVGVELGHVETLSTESAGKGGGRMVQSFLVHPPVSIAKPDEAKPLVLWVHGGPLGAWGNHWHWRWNPHVFAARGHRVLLVNPRISTGYGQAFIEEGFARWGAEPFHDLMAVTDAACARPDVDATRTATMGGSFGGYMVNWIATQTRRFRCIVTHASLWNLPAFHGTTDAGAEWEREFGNPFTDTKIYDAWSPHRLVTKIVTPMLVVHGEKDYRVPVSEGYMLFTALQRLGVPSRFLDFPDENHWILKPRNSLRWHQEIFDWLDKWLARGDSLSSSGRS